MSNDFSMPDTDGQQRASSQIDIYSDAISSTVDDELLENINLGLGNYSDAEYWQQVDSFKQGMFADTAFGRRLENRAIEETKTEMALEGWSYYDEHEDEVVTEDGWEDLSDEEKAEKDRRRYLEQRKEEIWGQLNDRERFDALVEVTGFSEEWTPPQWRLMMMRHEASRSKDGRLIDNIFGRVKEVKGSTSDLARKRLEQQR